MGRTICRLLLGGTGRPMMLRLPGMSWMSRRVSLVPLGCISGCLWIYISDWILLKSYQDAVPEDR
jgi:hypothetical protein